VIEAQSGENVTLDCAARGSPIPELTWTFLPRIPGSRFRPLTNTSRNGLNVVTLRHVTPDHTGTYTCTASVALDRPTATVMQVSSVCVGLYVEEGMRLHLIVTTCCHKYSEQQVNVKQGIKKLWDVQEWGCRLILFRSVHKYYIIIIS